MPDKYWPGVTLLLTLDQIRLYLQHDADLRGGVDPTIIPSPVGYDEFSLALNSNADNGIQVALVLEDDAGVRVKEHPPMLAELVALEATRRIVTPPRDPREEAGGRWLDSCHSELMDEVLWDNLDRLRKQQQWHEKGVAERHAKRQRREDNEAFTPFTPSRPAPPSTNAVAGPSTTKSTRASTKTKTPPPPPTSMAPVQPAPPSEEDAEMMEGEAKDTVDEAAREEDKGGTTKN
ncbi:hypothetical protein EV702DRAFT_1194220 [Suillus placidus]|uniref:Uncharacterized protein n=1 Tax=Suillus placidus TaxID=48579 RepID=A0A9P7A1V7_9AGAM|nr:hypothetical protein EV702DRAFT_1194220 [Suillus placidus]